MAKKTPIRKQRKRMAKATTRPRGARGTHTVGGLSLRVQALEGTVRELVKDVNALRNTRALTDHAEAVRRELGAPLET